MAFIIDDLYMVTKKNKEITIVSESQKRDIITGEYLAKEECDYPVSMTYLTKKTIASHKAILKVFPTLVICYFEHITHDSYKEMHFKQ